MPRSTTVSRVLVAVLAFGGPFVVGGCRVGTLSPEEFERAYPVARLTTLANPGRDESLAALREAVGSPVRITSITFTDERTTITAQNPRSPSDFDNHSFWQGDVLSTPQKISGSDEERYKRELFDLDSVPFDKLPELARNALTALPLDGAHVQHVGVDLDSTTGQLVIQVALESDRRRGRVMYDATGALLSAKPD